MGIGVFDGMEKTVLGRTRNKKFVDGFRGDVQIKCTEMVDSLKGGAMFTVEVTIVTNESGPPRTCKMADGTDRAFDAKAEHPVGSTQVWQQSMTNKTVAFPSCVRFLGALVGIEDQAELESDVMPEANATLKHACLHPTENPLVGALVRLETEHVVTKENKKDFVVHRWRPAIQPQ